MSSHSLTCLWENVRTWSDRIFTRIENGDINWSSYAEIQFERMRLSLSPSSDNATTQGSVTQSNRRVVCSDYNARRCKHRDTHIESGITFLHAYAWCHAALGSKNPHKCENKLQFAQDRQQQPQYQQQRFSSQQLQHQPLKQTNQQPANQRAPPTPGLHIGSHPKPAATTKAKKRPVGGPGSGTALGTHLDLQNPRCPTPPAHQLDQRDNPERPPTTTTI